jgi:hypothetical protein
MSSPLDDLLAVVAPSFGGLCAIPPFCLADAGRLPVVSWKMLPPLALLPGESLLKLSERFIVSNGTRLPLNSLLPRNFCAYVRCNLKRVSSKWRPVCASGSCSEGNQWTFCLLCHNLLAFQVSSLAFCMFKICNSHCGDDRRSHFCLAPTSIVANINAC